MSEIENKVTTYHDHDKYITTQQFNKLTSESFTARLKQANLASKHDLANFVKKTDFNNKLRNLKLKKLHQVNQNISLLKINIKKYRHLAQVFLLV